MNRPTATAFTGSLWQKAGELLSAKTPFVIATIVGHQGSTPRTSGTRMIITGDGRITGTIGGGLLEARVMEAAAEIIRHNGASAFMPFDLTGKEAETIDMICGGQADIFLDHITPSNEATDETAAIFSQWCQMLENLETGFFITAVMGAPGTIEQVRHGVMGRNGLVPADFPVSAEALTEITRNTAAMKVWTSDNLMLISEPAVKPAAAFLFGAGHVAKPTAHLLAMTGFYVTVLDDRPEFANQDHFPDAHDIRVIDSFESALDGLSVDGDAFVVIFTRGHLHDKTVLAQVLKTDATFIGMIGSRKKRDAIYDALRSEGFETADMERVHSPIGLLIGGQSPAEIAVSIVAQMIQERSKIPPTPFTR